MTDAEDSGFDPEQLEALEKMMDEIMEQESLGYQMVFWVSVGAANEMLECYDRYLEGSYEDAVLCMLEFGKIIEQLRAVVMRDEEDI